MFTKKEVAHIIIAILIMAFVMAFSSNQLDTGFFLTSLLFSTLIILVSVGGKKIGAYRRDIQIEHSIWKFSRWGLYQRSHTKSPIPFGLIIPLLASAITRGSWRFLTFLQFDGKPTSAKAARKSWSNKFSEIMEWDLAIISYWGLISVLGLALVAKYLTIPVLATYSVYYALWNYLIPFSQLHGSKLFFGSKPLYVNALIITAIVILIVLV